MSFIVQCLHVWRAASQPHPPSLLITACHREVKQINQKTLSQSLSCLARPASELTDRPAPGHSVLKDTIEQSPQRLQPSACSPGLLPVGSHLRLSPYSLFLGSLLNTVALSAHSRDKTPSFSQCSTPPREVSRLSVAPEFMSYHFVKVLTEMIPSLCLCPLQACHCAGPTAYVQEMCWASEHPSGWGYAWTALGCLSVNT